MVGLLSALVAMLVGCSDPEPGPSRFEASRSRRVFEPPAGELRAAPPHAIRADGVGPYLLGSSLRSVLGLVRFGPRVSLIELEGVADFSVVRAETDALLIGVRRAGGVTFIAVVRPELARTEGQVAVGSSTDELNQSLGAPIDPRRFVSDPALAAFESLPGGRFVLAGGKVAAVLVRQPLALREAGKTSPRCDEAAGTAVGGTEGEGTGPGQARDAGEAAARAALAPAVAEIGKLVPTEGARIEWLCSGEVTSGALISGADGTTLVIGSGGKWSVATRQPGAAEGFMAPIDVDGDGVDEVVIAEQERGQGSLRATVKIASIEGSKLLILGESRPYEISQQRAEWIGATLQEVELLLEVGAVADGAVVSGVLLQRGGDTFRIVAPLDEVQVSLRRPRVAAPAAPVDAGVAPAPGGKGGAARPVPAHPPKSTGDAQDGPAR